MGVLDFSKAQETTQLQESLALLHLFRALPMVSGGIVDDIKEGEPYETLANRLEELHKDIVEIAGRAEAVSGRATDAKYVIKDDNNKFIGHREFERTDLQNAEHFSTAKEALYESIDIREGERIRGSLGVYKERGGKLNATPTFEVGDLSKRSSQLALKQQWEVSIKDEKFPPNDALGWPEENSSQLSSDYNSMGHAGAITKHPELEGVEQAKKASEMFANENISDENSRHAFVNNVVARALEAVEQNGRVNIARVGNGKDSAAEPDYSR